MYILMAFWDPCETAITVRSSGSNCRSQRLVIGSRVGIPDGKIENSGKSIFEIRIPNFCYIQVIVFNRSYLPVAAVGTWQVRYQW